MKRIFMLLAPLALMLVAAMALSGVAQAAPVGSKADAQCLTLASKTLGPGFNPSNYAFHGGTAGNDNFTGQGTEGKGDVFCGFGGDDSIDTLGGGDIFIGGDGNDTVYDNDGTFNGGAGGDSVTHYNNGTFNGDAGDDSVSINAYIFNGGAGNDSVTQNFNTFNGGDGIDSVVANNGGTLVDVP